MKYKHIVFDIDGTLIDTEYAVLYSLQETIRALSGREIPCSETKCRTAFKIYTVITSRMRKNTLYWG